MRRKVGRRVHVSAAVSATMAAWTAWALVIGLCVPASAAEVTALAIMLPEEPTDFGWNQQAFEAAKAVAAKYHLKFMPASGLGYGDVHSELRELADDGASLIIAHASGYNTAAPEIGARETRAGRDRRPSQGQQARRRRGLHLVAGGRARTSPEFSRGK